MNTLKSKFLYVPLLIIFSLWFTISANAQQTIELTVPFSDGAFGTIGNNTNFNDNISQFSTLNISRVIFSQTVSNSSNPLFTIQGNDIPGTMTIVFENSKRVSFDCTLIWILKETGVAYFLGFTPATGVSFNLS